MKNIIFSILLSFFVLSLIVFIILIPNDKKDEDNNSIKLDVKYNNNYVDLVVTARSINKDIPYNLYIDTLLTDTVDIYLIENDISTEIVDKINLNNTKKIISDKVISGEVAYRKIYRVVFNNEDIIYNENNMKFYLD